MAPSTELRRWYGHDPAKFETFAARYREELAAPPASDAWRSGRGRQRGVVLVTATRLEHSAAEVLFDVLSGRPETGGRLTARPRPEVLLEAADQAAIHPAGGLTRPAQLILEFEGVTTEDTTRQRRAARP